MKCVTHSLFTASLLLALLAPVARAQEFSVSAGAMGTPDAPEHSYSWQLDYRQHVSRHFALSAAWINEGHVPGHHRDGWAAQAWLLMPTFEDNLTFAVGAGSYRYYDTQTLPNGDSSNVHGWAPIYSLSATYYTQSPWFFLFTVNRINPSDNIAVNTVTVGAGYFIGDRTPGRGVSETLTGDNEFTLFIGQSVVNTLVSESGLAFGAEYRHSFADKFDWTLGWIYEGDAEIIRRNGLVSQLWLTSGLINEHVTFGIGFGAYVYVDRKNPPTGDETNASVSPIASPTVSYRFSPNWHARLTWNRILTNNSRDADVFLLGVGYRWGKGI